MNNLPVDLARELGADVVIAVNLGTPLMKREELKDVRGVVGQMLGILTEQNVQSTLATIKDTDILILPELGDFSAADFDQMKKTLPIGEAAARKAADRLAKLGVADQRFAAYQAVRTAPQVPDQRPVDEIRFDAMRRVNPIYAETVLDVQPGQPIDPAKLDADLLRLYGTDDFERVNYRVIDTPTRRILNIEAIEKSWGPNYARIGLGLSSDFSGNAFFNILGQYRRTWINDLGGEWQTDLVLGRNTSINTEFYQPLEPRHRFFVAPHLHVERYYVEVFDQKHSIAEYSFPTALAGLDIGAQSYAVRRGAARAFQRRHQGEARFGCRGVPDLIGIDDDRRHPVGRLCRPARQLLLPEARLRCKRDTAEGFEGTGLGSRLRSMGRLCDRRTHGRETHAAGQLPRDWTDQRE